MIRRYSNNNNRCHIPTVSVMISIVLLSILPVTFVSAWMTMIGVPTKTTVNPVTVTTSTSHSLLQHHRRRFGTSILFSSRRVDEADNDEFTSFAATLVEDDRAATSSTTTNTPRASNNKTSQWQTNLDKLIFDRTTTIAQRQILISDLINANNEIRQSFTTALRDRTVRCCCGCCSV